MQNPAALQGWIKSTDPKTGRVFYANHITRKTQWDPPENWVDVAVVETPRSSLASFNDKQEEEEEPLPSNWEVMHDPTTGKPFYVDHERKITTWTRPQTSGGGGGSDRAATSAAPASATYNPAATSSSSSSSAAALQRILQQQQQRPNTTTTSTSSSSSTFRYQQQQQQQQYSYHDDYYSSHAAASAEEDFSDALPVLEFAVKSVADYDRSNCPLCAALFTVSKRRHHCRLCGDVFCDACSNHRVTLPLEGSEFNKPVRVCNTCNYEVVEKGNFFSMRRYLVPLQLFQQKTTNDESTTTAGSSSTTTTTGSAVATTSTVNAALSAMSNDFDQWLGEGGSMKEKVTLSAEVLIPEMLKCLVVRDTANYAIRALAALLALETMAGSEEYSITVYTTTTSTSTGDNHAMHGILDILERSGSDRKTLFVQEQAARTICYLTDPKLILSVIRACDGDNSVVEQALDLPRAMRCMLDHASGSSRNINLQRWATATIKNLVLEDQRRSTMAMNDVAAVLASGEERVAKLPYESFLPEMVSTGGIMILGSLIGADDADTRAHAVAAVSATLESTRAIDSGMAALSEMTAGMAGRTTTRDGSIVRSIVAGGGCGSSVSQLLLSADQTVAGMGCRFLSSLVMPLLSDAKMCASMPSQYDYRNDEEGRGACCEAAIEIATGSCLPALLGMIGENARRPMELRRMAAETLAAVVYAIGEMGRAWAHHLYEEGLERAGAPSKLKDAIVMLNEEGVVEGALSILQSPSGQSLGSAKDTPSLRIRESAGIMLSALTTCSAEAIMELQTRQVLSALLVASTDSSMTVDSTLRGDGAPRCLGVLETVSAILMFALQHPSGASNELLDRLIEMIDAGAIPYLSRVLNTKMDWESSEKALGGMKGRAASCRLLCCLFGIALTDGTGIGMRRLMDAVESDSRSYRSTTSSSSGASERLPRNIVEATLTVLKRASNYARKLLLGSLNKGPHYSQTLLDLVDASLLATGSMCGSSVAPGGSEGSMITGESFLVSRNDPYSGRRQEICSVACDVVVRAGRSEPALLPTMLVGGFGESALLSSLRLALAIAQNGTNDQHAKLALSGILVPISDALRSALSSGDLYKFSASLAMVRFCGPHVAAGQGGGVESVRDAIRVATNVLILPVNPDASLEQLETQEALKSECIAALESLSKNASLWSSISTDALPSIVRYLQSSVILPAELSGKNNSKAAAIRAIRQIVQVPSHAVSAAEAGIVEPLGRLLKTCEPVSQEDEIPMLALEVLHVIASNDNARRKARFLESGLVRSICAALGKSATYNPRKPSDSRADVVFFGLEILHSVLRDIEGDSETHFVIQSPLAATFLDSVVSEPGFIKAMCSTLLLKTGMTLPRHDGDNEGSFDIPKSFGPPLILVQEKCAAFADTHEASAYVLFNTAVFACAMDTALSESFWNTVLLANAPGIDNEERLQLAATLSAHILSLLTADYKPFLPVDSRRMDDYLSMTRPLVRHRLLEALKESMDSLSGENNYGPAADPYMTSLIVAFNVPHICLSLWKDPALLDLAFDLIKHIVEQDPDEVIHLFVEGKPALMSLFDLLNIDSSTIESSNQVDEIRRFLASILAQLAESGLLTSAVEKFDVKGSAIAALASACLSEQNRSPDDDEDTTSSRLSSTLMGCLVELCKVKDGKDKTRIQLSSVEAKSMAKNLGKKICHMVLSRFLERAKLKQYEMDDDDQDILDAPDVAMLCAIAQHDEALDILRSIGGMHALSLVASEGDLTAMKALDQASTAISEVMLEGDAFQALMGSLTNPDARWKHDVERASLVEALSFDLIARLCLGSRKGRNAVAGSPNCLDFVVHAMEFVSGMVLVDPAAQENEAESSDTEEESVKAAEPEESNDGEADDGVASAAVEEPLPPSYEEVEKTLCRPLTPNEVRQGGSACSFLSSIVSVEPVQRALGGNEAFVKSLSYLASFAPDAELQLACVNLLAAIAPFAAGGGSLPMDKLADVLMTVLTSDRKIKASSTLNANLLQKVAAEGVITIFDYVPTSTQRSLAAAIAECFKKSVKACSVTRSTTSTAERAFSAELTYSLTLALLLARGKEYEDDLFSQTLLTSFLQLLLWRRDPKTSLGNTDERSWDAAVANCLTLFSIILRRPESKLESAKIDLKKLAGTSIMLARPGKAPRRAIDLLSALKLVIDSNDSSASIAAQKIADRLF